MVALELAGGEVRVGPAFVDGGPGHDGGVVAVAEDGGAPLGVEALRVVFGEGVGVGHFAPDEKAHAVGPVEEARILKLLVLAAPVKTHGFAELDVVAEGRGGGRCKESGGPVALVEEQGLEVGAVVEANGGGRPGEGSHTGCGVDGVEGRGRDGGGEEPDGKIIESGVFRGPECEVLEPECVGRGCFK